MTADEIIAHLDELPIAPEKHHQISYALLSMIRPNDPLVLDVMAAFRKDPLAIRDDRKFLDLLYVHGGNPDSPSNALHSLARTLVIKASPVDGYYAEYLFDWSEKCGLDQAEVAALLERHFDE